MLFNGWLRLWESGALGRRLGVRWGSRVAARRGAAWRRRAVQGVEWLEDRTLLATITVTGLGDAVVDGDGQVTLREAILGANTDTSLDGP